MDKLKKLFKSYYVLSDISGILFWDNATNLPSNSIESRSEQMSVLSHFTDKIFRDPEVSDYLKDSTNLSLSEIDKKNLNLMRGIITKENAIDTKLKSDLIKQKLKCEHLWREARNKNNSSIIENEFNNLLDLVHEEASQLSKATNLSPYDSLISKYDMDYNSSKIDKIFEIIKSEIIPIYLSSNKITKPSLYQNSINEIKILEKTKESLANLNFDFSKGRIDQSHHPFCGGANNDVRITTRFENNILETLSALFHETGHGVYEQNRPKKYLYEPVGQSRSLSVHESQSLFYENHIFKSKNYFLKFSEIFESQENLFNSFEEHYHSIRSNPIRVSSDEFSYPIHVYIRYEIEKIIFNEKIKFKEIKSLWNSYYEKYLGIKVSNESEGVLQDIHWYEGIFGYFPTYALGAMISSQIKYNCPFYENFSSDPNFENITDIANWLNENIHQKASLYSSDEMLKEISGKNLNSKFYLKHLKERFIN
tara:strand:+ start:1049 stop:2488 length:1440 start_codon:yes stop_codon:yes gene_type:complete